MLAEPPNLGEVWEIVKSTAEDHGIIRCFREDENLVDGGITSMAIVEIMLAIESRYNLIIPDDKLTPENFMSIQSIHEMLMHLRPSQHDLTKSTSSDKHVFV